MRRWLCVLPLFLVGCETLRQAAQEVQDLGGAAGEVLAERGGDVVDQIGKAAGGDPLAIVGAVVTVVGIVGAIVTRYLLKKRKKSADS